MSAAIRNDKNSAFGQDFGSINYPSATLSWVVNDESFFPKTQYLSSLRLRAATGKSGQKPNFRDAITFFNAQTVTVAGVDVPGITVGGTGNPELRPEKSRETELGFDVGFLDERIGAEVTHYQKRTDDLLIAVPLPPSLGLTTTQFQNLGSVSNKGWEYVINTRVVDMPRVGFDFTITGSTNNNKLLTLGFLPTGDPVPPIVVNTQQQHRVGVPLGSYFQKSYTFNDTNGDGIIARSEITLSDTSVYLGNPLPTPVRNHADAHAQQDLHHLGVLRSQGRLQAVQQHTPLPLYFLQLPGGVRQERVAGRSGGGYRGLSARHRRGLHRRRDVHQAARADLHGADLGSGDEGARPCNVIQCDGKKSRHLDGLHWLRSRDQLHSRGELQHV